MSSIYIYISYYLFGTLCHKPNPQKKDWPTGLKQLQWFGPAAECLWCSCQVLHQVKYDKYFVRSHQWLNLQFHGKLNGKYFRALKSNSNFARTLPVLWHNGQDNHCQRGSWHNPYQSYSLRGVVRTTFDGWKFKKLEIYPEPSLVSNNKDWYRVTHSGRNIPFHHCHANRLGLP